MATPDRVRRSDGGFHYAWIIIAILSVVQIFGQSISMSAGIMVPELRTPLDEGGRFGWSPAIIGFALAGYYLVGLAHFAVQWTLWRHSGSPKTPDGGRGSVRGEHDPDRVHHPGLAILHRVQRHAGAHFFDCHGPVDGRGQPLVQAAARTGHRPHVGGRWRRRRRPGSRVFLSCWSISGGRPRSW